MLTQAKLSVLLWLPCLHVQVSIKYVLIVLRADVRGERAVPTSRGQTETRNIKQLLNTYAQTVIVYLYLYLNAACQHCPAVIWAHHIGLPALLKGIAIGARVTH